MQAQEQEQHPEGQLHSEQEALECRPVQAQEQEQHPEGQLHSEQEVLECRPVQAQEQEQHPEGQLHSEQAAVHPEVELADPVYLAIPVGPVEHPAGAVCTEQAPRQEEEVPEQEETQGQGVVEVRLHSRRHPVGPCDLRPAHPADPAVHPAIQGQEEMQERG